MYLRLLVISELLFFMQSYSFKFASKNSNREVTDEDQGKNDDGGDDDPDDNGSGGSGDSGDDKQDDEKGGKGLPRACIAEL